MQQIKELFFIPKQISSIILKNLCKRAYIECCIGFNRKVLNECLPFPKNLPMHDSYIGLVAELKFKVEFLPAVLLNHRKHQDNTSATSTGKSKYALKEKLVFRVNLIKALCKRLFLGVK